MKIAQVCPYNYFRSGGVQVHIEKLAEEMRKRGHIVRVITPNVKGVQNTDENVITLGKSLKVSMIQTQGELSMVVGKMKNPIVDVLDREDFDIIHFHEPVVPILSLQILSESQSVNIATFHAALPDNVIGKSLEALYMPLASYILKVLDGVIAVSNVPANLIRDFYKREVKIIPNGIDLGVYGSGVEPIEEYLDGKLNILFVGRLDKRKGVKYLVKAFEKLKRHFRDVRLIIAGKGNEQKSIQKYIKKHKVEDVHMLGFVSDEEKYRLFKTCDIFCSPAICGESFGIVLLEAMGAGKPVVAYANPGYKTVLRGRGSLLLVEPKDIDGLAGKLELLCEDEDLREMMGKWGLAEVKQYSWDKICDRVLEFYKQNLEEVGKGRKKKRKKTLSKIIENWVKKLNSETKDVF